MRIKLDENLPGRLASALGGLGDDVDTSVQEGVAGEKDEILWSAAQQAGRYFVTQVLDFSDVRRF